MTQKWQATGAVLVAVSVKLKASEQQFVFLTHPQTYKHSHAPFTVVLLKSLQLLQQLLLAIGNFAALHAESVHGALGCVFVREYECILRYWHANVFWHCNWISCFILPLHSCYCYSWLSIAVAKALLLFRLSIESVLANFTQMDFRQFFSNSTQFNDSHWWC